MEVNNTGVLNKRQGIGTIVLYMEDNMGIIHNISFNNVYYFPRAPKLLFIPHKCAQYIGGSKVGREGTYLKLMYKRSIRVCKNRKSQRIVLHG